MRFLHGLRRGRELRLDVAPARLLAVIVASMLIAGAMPVRASDDAAGTADSKVNRAARRTGEWIEQAGKKTGAAVDRAAKKTGAAADNAARKTGAAVEKAASKTESALQRALRRTGEALQRAGRAVRGWFSRGES
jgi:hypothetical protein